jgi:hypothetical protein
MSSLQQLVIETWVEYSIATVVVVLRYYTRIKMVGTRRLDYDDYLIPIAWIRAINPIIKSLTRQ